MDSSVIELKYLELEDCEREREAKLKLREIELHEKEPILKIN